MPILNQSARRYRLFVSGQEMKIAEAEINQEAYQYERYPQKFLTTVIHGFAQAGSDLIDYSQSINPVLNPSIFSFGNTVTFEVQKTDNSYVQIFTGVIIGMRYSDGRREEGKTAQRSHPSLQLRVTDSLGSTATIDYPQDLSDITIGSSKAVADIVNSFLINLGLTSLVAPIPANTATSRAPIVFNPNEARSVVDLGHKLYWCNPPSTSAQYLYNDAAGNSRIGELSFAPTSFLIDGTVADDLIEYIMSDQPSEIPPKSITITGQYDNVVTSSTVSNTTQSRGDLEVPIKPRVITEGTENTPAVLEDQLSRSNVTLSRTTVTTEITDAGASFNPEIITTTVERQAACLLFTKHPDDIRDDTGASITPASPWRTSTTLLTANTTVHRKIFGGPSNRLSSETSTTTGLSVQADDNITLFSDSILGTEDIAYGYNARGVLSSKITTQRQARGIADQSASKDEDRLQLVLAEETEELWEPVVGSGDTDRYVFNRLVKRYFDEGSSNTESISPESQPPQTDFYQGRDEIRPQDVSCTEDFIYGVNGVARDRTFDYGNALLSPFSCRRSAQIEAAMIHGQSFARNIKFPLTDDVIDKLWPAGAAYEPYIRVLDEEDGDTYTYLVDNLRIRAEKDKLYGECYGIFFGVETAANATVTDTLVRQLARPRIRVANNLRVLPGGGLRVRT